MEKRKPLVPPNKKCPHNRDGIEETCPLTCKYNHFESDDLTIHAYELKCLDCGWRDTIGYRSDEEDDEEEAEERAVDFDPKKCPFCDQCGLEPGTNPCNQKPQGSL